MYEIRACSLSTQSLFYFIITKRGWNLLAMHNANNYPFTGRLLSDRYFCLVCDIDAPPTRHQLMRDKLTHQVLVEAKRQSQVFNIPVIMLHVGEVLVKLGVA